MRIGPYEVVGPLGRGGMGRVLEVRDPRLPERRLALKLVRGKDPLALRRFQREAELLARVRHPGVVSVHATGESPHGPWIAMDLVAGESLADLLKDGPLPRARAVQLVLAVAEALAAVHAAGVVHRDLKPSNVLLPAPDRPVLIDFGLARSEEHERLTRTGVLIGSPHYMAPEQVNGSPSAQDARVDVWGLGTLLYELLEGYPPCGEGRSLGEVVYRICELEPRWPELPAPLLGVLERSLAKRPADRFPDARAFADALRAAQEGRTLSAGGGPSWWVGALVAALLAPILYFSLDSRRPLPGYGAPSPPPVSAPAPPPPEPAAPEPGPTGASEAATRRDWLRLDQPQEPERVGVRALESGLLVTCEYPTEHLLPTTLGVWRVDLPRAPTRLHALPLPGPVASLEALGRQALLVVLTPARELFLLEADPNATELHRLRVPIRPATITATALVPGGLAIGYGPDEEHGQPEPCLVLYQLQGDAAVERWARPVSGPLAGQLAWSAQGLVMCGVSGSGILSTSHGIELTALPGELLAQTRVAYATTALDVDGLRLWRGDTSGVVQPLTLPGLEVGEPLPSVASRSRLDVHGLALAPSLSGMTRAVRAGPGVMVAISSERSDSLDPPRVSEERELRVWTTGRDGRWVNSAALSGFPRPLSGLELSPDGEWVILAHGGSVELWRRAALPALRGDEDRLPRWADALRRARGED